jgi:hypothetical protein
MPLTCLYCGEEAPKTDLTYFFTSCAVSYKLSFSSYNILFLSMRLLLSPVSAFMTAVLLVSISATNALSVATCKDVSFGV